MTFMDDCSGWLFRMTIPDAYFRWLLQMTISDVYSGCLFQMTFPDYCSGWLFVIQRLIRILATNLYFHGQFLFQPIIRLIGPTTDSFLNDSFLLQNYGPDPPWQQSDIYDTQSGKLFYWIQYKNDGNRSLAAFDLFHVFTQSIKFYTFDCHKLKTIDVWKKLTLK